MAKHVYVSRIESLLKLKSDMLGHRVTQEDLARAVGVRQPTISNWMSDQGINRLPNARQQKALEEFFGVPWTAIWSLKIKPIESDGENTPLYDNEPDHINEMAPAPA